MVKCSSCGFDNREAKVCGKCGGSIQRYVKAKGYGEYFKETVIRFRLRLS